VSTAGISLPLQFERISSGINFRYQSIAGSLLPLQITKPVSSRNAGKLSLMDLNGLSAISSLQQEHH
jgi:hypothetical protein